MGSFGNEKVHSSSSKKVKAPPRSEFVISMSVFVAITTMILAFDPEKRKLVKKLITNYRFLTMFVALFGFSGFTLCSPTASCSGNFGRKGRVGNEHDCLRIFCDV